VEGGKKDQEIDSQKMSRKT